MHDQILASARRQIDELECFARNSDAFSEGDAVELIRWFTWRTERLVDTDIAALRGLEAHEVEPGLPFTARWEDVAREGGAAYSKLGTAFNRLAHIGVVERLGRDRKGHSVWRLLRPALAEAA